MNKPEYLAYSEHPILKATQSICDGANMVKISQLHLQNLAAEILQSNIAPQTNDQGHWLTAAPLEVNQFLAASSLEQKLLFITVFHSAGFCYWGEPRWQISYQGKKYNGAMAWLICLSREKRLLSPEFLSRLSKKNWQTITRGQDDMLIPLFLERLTVLQRLGDDLQNGLYSPLALCTTGGEALDLAFFIGKTFPGFNDRTKHKNLTIPFLKKAQLLVADYHYLCSTSTESTPPISGLDKLTAFADYKIPQFLRHKNVLAYAPDLSRLIDNQSELKAGRAEEVEIRSATIMAVERLKELLRISGLQLDASQLDNRLWLAAQNSKDKMLPYHRCRSVFY